MSDEKKIKIEFAPGCFDNLDMTQEEMDKFVVELQSMADSGELFENSQELDDEAFAELSPEEQEILICALNENNNARAKRLN
jgi:hypothetical protein